MVYAHQMQISVALKTPPAEEPVTLNEAVNYLKLPTTPSVETDLVTRCIKAAREDMENEYSVAMITQTWTQRMSCFPSGRCIELRRRPLQTITSVKYRDESDSQQTLSASDYIVHPQPVYGLIEIKQDKSWPSTFERLDAIEIEFVAGYGAAAAVPSRLFQELLLRLTEKYENRGEMLPENFKRHPAIGSWSDRVIHV